MKNLFALILFIFLCACDRATKTTTPREPTVNGTDTGNPTPEAPINPDPSKPLVTYGLVSITCKKLVECEPTAVQADCIDGNLPAATFGPKLGVATADKDLTLEQIIEKEKAGALNADSTAANDCKTDIQAIQCHTVESLVAATPMTLSVNGPGPYGFVSEMIPPSCDGVFK